jgi:hypothetical protein
MFKPKLHKITNFTKNIHGNKNNINNTTKWNKIVYNNDD